MENEQLSTVDGRDEVVGEREDEGAGLRRWKGKESAWAITNDLQSSWSTWYGNCYQQQLTIDGHFATRYI